MSDRGRTPSALLGRAPQRAQLASVLRDERSTVFLRAAAGSGKTALLDGLADAALAEGWTVHRVTGTPAEQSFPFATLAHLVLPLRPHFANLAPRAREALETALGMSVAEPAGVMALGIALTDLLTDVATAAPVLVIVDDEHWIDAASAAVLSFVARRLSGLPVAIAAAARDGHPRMLDVVGSDVVRVPALDPDVAEDLLRRTCPDLAGVAAASVLARAAGNPLAIIELGVFAERQGDAVGGELPDRVEHMFADRIAELPPAEAAELLRMALDVRAGPSSSYRPATVEQASRSRLVVADPVSGGVRFTHPLVADVVAARATANELRQAHRELAELPSPDIERAAHHRAAAAVDPDESIARDLEHAAHRAVRRGGSAAAVDWLLRAAELSPAPDDRQRRLRDAAYVASQSGLLDKAEALADRSSSYDSSPASATTVLTDAFVKFYRAGALGAAHRVVANALTRHADDLDDVSVERFANILLAVGTYAADATTWDRTERALAPLDGRLPDVTSLVHAAWSDPSARGGRALRDEVHARLTATGADNPWDVTRLLIAAYYLDLLPEHRHLLDRVVDREAAAGAVANEVTGLNLLVKADMAAGAWDDALDTSERGLKTARRHGFALFEHHFLIYRAELLAHRGEFDEALRLQSIVERWARPRGVGLLTQHVDTVGVAVGLAAGDHETAWQFANGLSPTDGISPYAHQARRGVLDHVDAAVATGRTDAARAHVAAGLRAGLRGLSPRLDMLMLAAEALTADAKVAGALFDAAVGHPAADAFVFDAARIALHHGSWLLTRRRPDDAAAALRRALTTFEHLGAAPWAARARDDLQRAARPNADTRLQALTAQELTIAELAASGLSNKQIGAQLFLSPRTVSTHLYRIFPKLGIGSRAALRDALTDARSGGRTSGVQR